MVEHVVFRGANFLNYNPDDYDKPQNPPLGLAALFASLFGVIRAVLGMATTWYIGVLGKNRRLRFWKRHWL